MSEMGSASNGTPRRGMWQVRRADLLAAFLYAIIAIVVTYPIIFRMSTAIYGRTGDPTHVIWTTWWRKYSLINHLDYNFLSLSQAPFGTDYVYPWPFPGMLAPLTLLAILFGELAAYNLMALGGYTLSGFTAYVLANRFSHNKSASFAAGLVFALSPYAISHTQDHIGLAQQWVIPLFILALFNLHKKQSVVSALRLGGAFALAGYLHAYYGYYAAIAALTFAVVEICTLWRNQGWRTALNPKRFLLYSVAAVSGLILYSPEIYTMLRDFNTTAQSPLRIGSTLARSHLWFFQLSSRPWDFILPPIRHPLLGEFSRSIYEQISNIPRLHFAPPVLRSRFPDLDTRWFWYNTTGGALYLGFVNLVVAGYAIWQRCRHRHAAITSLNGKQSLWFGYFAALFIVALLFTAPPYLPVGAFLRPLWHPLHNVVIPMPSLLTMSIAPPMRDSSRFAILVFVSLASVVAMGLDHLLSRIETFARRVILSVGFLGILFFEFAQVSTITPLTTPQEFLWLSEQPRSTIVAVYPFGNVVSSSFQRIHELPVIDSLAIDAAGMRDNIFQIESWTIGSLDHPNIGPKLAALGVTYVVNGDTPVDPPPDGLSLLFTTETAQVFEVTAYPAPLVVLHTPSGGLWVSDAAWAWQSEEYAITIWNPLNEAAEIDVELTLADDAAGTELLATRILTPPPEQIIWSGLLIDNPYIPPDYSPGAIQAERTAEGMAFRSMLIQPGETALTLSWSGGNHAQDYPAVTGAAILLEETE